MIFYRNLLRFSLVLALVGITIRPVAGHGGGTPQLTNVAVGPYWLSTWIQPDPPRPDNFHLTIAVAEPGDPTAEIKEAGPPVLGALVTVELRSYDTPVQVVSAVASHDQAANKLFYEADLTLPYPGLWKATITVVGADGRSGSVDFEVLVDIASGVDMTWWLVGGGVVVAFVAVIWLRRRMRVAQPG